MNDTYIFKHYKTVSEWWSWQGILCKVKTISTFVITCLWNSQEPEGKEKKHNLETGFFIFKFPKLMEI